MNSIKTLISLALTLIFAIIFTACGEMVPNEESKQTAEPWTLNETTPALDEEKISITILEFEEIFEECSQMINLNCQEGDYISETTEGRYKCDIFIFGDGGIYYRYDSISPEHGDLEINLYSYGEIVSRLFNLSNSSFSPMEYDEIRRMYRLDSSDYLEIPDRYLLATGLIDGEDLKCDESDFKEFVNGNSYCWPPLRRKHLDRFKEFCRDYGGMNVQRAR